MKTETHLYASLSQNLAKLFYAIAASDGHVQQVEIDALKTFINNEWPKPNNNSKPYETIKKQIEKSFDALISKEDHDPNHYFNDFITYKKNNTNLFSEDIINLILKTASAIANSFSSLNKSELIMLAKLEIELKK
ncbi:hypothetical protein GSB9_00888 [Flavobacteriaceae bacterium GSB9]|nr:hypothetical protein GSB9_00888 [Flavobacteriaceae bacterium GSB9]